MRAGARMSLIAVLALCSPAGALAQSAPRACLDHKARTDEQKKTTSFDVSVNSLGDRYTVVNKTAKYGVCKLDISFDSGESTSLSLRFGPRQTVNATFYRDSNAKCWVQDLPPCMGVLW